jgi:hypothetical protein
MVHKLIKKIARVRQLTSRMAVKSTFTTHNVDGTYRNTESSSLRRQHKGRIQKRIGSECHYHIIWPKLSSVYKPVGKPFRQSFQFAKPAR